MFTLIKNFRTLFLLTISAGVQDIAPGGETTVDTSEAVEAPLTPEQQATLDAVKVVTQEQLKDVVAVQDYLQSNRSVKEGAKGPAVKDIQEILLFLGIDISFTSSRTGQKVEGLAAIDGDYGNTIVKAVKEFQRNHKDAEGNALTVDGKVGPDTYDAMLVAANIKGGVSAVDATTGDETIATSRVDTATAALEAATKAADLEAAEAAEAAAKLATATADAERERGEHKEIKESVGKKTSLLESASENLGKAQTNLLKNNAALEAARLAIKEANGEIEDLEKAEAAVKLAEAALKTQTEEVEEFTRELFMLEQDIALAQTAYDDAGNKAHEEQGEVEAAQAVLDALNYTGDVNNLPTLEDAQAAAESAREAATAAKDAATAADTLWNSYYFSTAGRKSAWETANSVASEAEAKADAAELVVKVIKAQQSIIKETGEATTSAEHLESVQKRIAELREKLSQAKSSLESANTSTAQANGILAEAEGKVTTETPEAEAAQAAMIALSSALEKAETDVGDTTKAIGLLQGVIDRVTPELAVLQPELEKAEAELKAANAALADANAKDESGRVGVERTGRELTDATGELTEATEEHEYNEYYSPEHALAALEGVKGEKGAGAIKAMQQALIDAGADLGPTGADGSPGNLTKTAIEAKPDVALQALAVYIDTIDNAAVEARTIKERPRSGDAIDVALNNLFSDDVEDLDAALLEIAKEFTGKDIDANTRNLNAQYIALKLQSLGQENSTMAQSLMEKIMAEGKGHYENESNELNIRQALIDGSGRFARHLGTFPENFTGSYFKIGQTLQGRASRARIENGMEQGVKGNASEVMQAIFGVDTDFIAHRMHMVTGQGVDGDADMSLELGGGIILENAYYDEISGAIYATVAKGNGCEGNLVVIPVETFTPPKPRPVVPRTGTPLPPSVDLPDFPGVEVDCNGEKVEGKYVMSYNGYQVYVAVGKVFRVKGGIVESRNFGMNEGLAWKNMSVANVRANIAAIMQSGSIKILRFTLSNLWETVGSAQNVCRTGGGDTTGGGTGGANSNPSDTDGPTGDPSGGDPGAGDD